MIFSCEDVCLEVSVPKEDYIVAEMDYISLAMMYRLAVFN
jgi:hypothetical protein